MTIDQTINLAIAITNVLVASGTITLAVVALKTISHTRKELRNRQLDEIIDWAIDTSEFYVEDRADNKQSFKSININDVFMTKLFRYGNLERAIRKGKQIHRIALLLKEAPLQTAIEKLIIDSRQHMLHLGQQILALSLNFNNAEFLASEEHLSKERELLKHLELLRKSSDMVVQEASKLKTI